MQIISIDQDNFSLWRSQIELLFNSSVKINFPDSAIDGYYGKIKCDEVKAYLENGTAILFAAVEEETEEAKAEFYSSKRVLIVEDNELNMEIMGALMEMIGIQTEKAYNGQEAVNRLQEVAEGWFDLIFMDIQMPVLDGYEATRRIRRMEREDLKHIPIFAVSANALAEDVKNSLEAGMNGHISKPVDLDLLKKVMGECLK